MEARRTGTVTAACAALALGLAACGGEERQDENEPEGKFKVDVVDASFPAKQKLAKRSELKITVRNTGDRAVPNIAVTVDGFDTKLQDPDLADPSRPVFVINGQPREIGDFAESKELAPEGGGPASQERLRQVTDSVPGVVYLYRLGPQWEQGLPAGRRRTE